MISKKIPIALTIALLLWSGPARSASRAKGNLRYSIVVAKFENNTGYYRTLGDEWATTLTTQLQKSGHFVVIGQSDMQQEALGEQVRGASGTTAQDRRTAVRGQMTPAQLIVKGTITNLKEGAAEQESGFTVGGIRLGGKSQTTEIRATIQMIDASTGAVVAAEKFVGVAQQRSLVARQNQRGDDVKMGKEANVHEAFENAIEKAIPWMVAQLPSFAWRGSVVKVDNERVIINRGSREGVSVGDEFIVGESEVLRDPDSGDILDEIVHERARIKVVQVTERTAICSLLSGSIGQIVERMAIRYRREI